MTTWGVSRYWDLFKNQHNGRFRYCLIIFHTVHPHLLFLQGRGCWPQMLSRTLGPSLLPVCSPVSAITSHWFWFIPWLPSYPQLSNLQDLSHFKDFSTSQELHLFLFGSPSSMSRPLPPGTPDKPLPFRPDVYSQTPQFQGANSKLLLETLRFEFDH